MQSRLFIVLSAAVVSMLMIGVNSYQPTDVFDYTPAAVTCGPGGVRFDWWTLIKMCKQGCTWMPIGDMDTGEETYGFISHTTLDGKQPGTKIAILFQWTLTTHPAKGGWYYKFRGAKYWQTVEDTWAAPCALGPCVGVLCPPKGVDPWPRLPWF